MIFTSIHLKGMQMKHFATLSLCAALVVVGCKQGAEVPPLAGWETFSDQFFRTTFTQPSGWQVQKDPSRVTITSSLGAMEKFFDPYSKKDPGAQLVVAGDKTDTLSTLQAVFDEYKKGLEESGFTIKSVDTTVTIDGNPAIQIEYGGMFNEQTRLNAVRAYTYTDTTSYYVHFGGFNEFYTPYRGVYDSVMATIVLPKPIIKEKDIDPSLPVEATDRFSNEFVEFSYPANFTPSIDKPSSGVEYAMSIKGYRLDSYITIDIRPAQALTLEKVVEQNEKNFRSAGSPKSITVGGEPATYLDYSPTRGVSGRVHFIVKNDKFYRVIMVYPSSLRSDFRPAFEKTVASLKLK
jgi:hypothetical protein